MARDMTEIRRDIALSRERLRETAEAIGWKADVPSRARDLVHEARSVLQSRRTPAEIAANGSDGPGLGDRLNAAKDAVTGAAGAVGERAAQARDAAAEKLTSARETASGEAGQVGERLSSATGAAHDALPARQDVAEGVRSVARTARANPTGLALGGLALGIAGALLLPSTRLEEERLAPVAEDLVERGASAGADAIEHGGGRVAQAVGN